MYRGRKDINFLKTQKNEILKITTIDSRYERFVDRPVSFPQSRQIFTDSSL